MVNFYLLSNIGFDQLSDLYKHNILRHFLCRLLDKFLHIIENIVYKSSNFREFDLRKY